MGDEEEEVDEATTEREVAVARILRELCRESDPAQAVFCEIRLPSGEEPTSFSISRPNGAIYNVQVYELRKPRNLR